MSTNYQSIYNLEYLDTLIIKYWSASPVHAADLTEYSEGQLGWALSNAHAVSSLTDWDEWQTTQALFGRTMTYWEARDFCNLLYANGQNVLDWNSDNLRNFIEYTKSTYRNNNSSHSISLDYHWENIDEDAMNKYISQDTSYSVDTLVAILNVGNLRAEFTLTDDSDSNCRPCLWVNIYVLGRDTGYGYTPNGTAYDMLDDAFTITEHSSREAFMKQAEELMTAFIHSHDVSWNLIEEAYRPVGKWE